MTDWSEFQGHNAGYVWELYDKYRRDPLSVDEATRTFFEETPPPDALPLAGAAGDTPDARTLVGAVSLAESIRRYGHLAAQIDPLGTRPPGDPSLELETHGLTRAALERLPAQHIDAHSDPSETAWDVIERLRRVYCHTIGYDYAQLFVLEERAWLRHAAETGRFRPPIDPVDAPALLDRITQVEVFERFLQRTFPGKTRFSIEGLDMLVPILDEIVVDAADAGMHHVLIGMAHRGRLNVLAHVLQKPYEQILAEFKDPIERREGYRIDLGRSGDVKYHSGARLAVRRQSPQAMVITMAPNPSHLEFVDPVVVGMARAAGTNTDGGGAAEFDPAITLPILIHGDSAFPGQGIVAETLNLSQLDGYDTGGTIHIIVNNQLGFTATSDESYSTSYASGLARGFKIPIVHVNADDPVACIECARLALAYRAHFKRDFLIDLVGYRRHGHNEGDEPTFTQPLMYKKIAQQPTVRELWQERLVESGLITQHRAEAFITQYYDELGRKYTELKPSEDLPKLPEDAPPPGAARKVKTAVPLATLSALNDALIARPEGFVGHPKLEKARDRRRTAFADPNARTIDWALGEELAYASILADGIPIRLTGEDVERGTFSHRHAAYHDYESGAKYIPLQAFAAAKARFEIHNSPLSENATIGFEYGYNVQAPGRLVIWEGQYGDFVNGAQVILDEFVVSARAKWGLTPSLVLLLPHGYEGQGPDHSTGRPERFLESAADINLRLANCTTAAQYFHLLRRQALLLETDPLPLIVLTPKSLLRHPLVSSSPRELAEGCFAPVLDDPGVKDRSAVKRLVVCSGKVFVDVVSSPKRDAEPRLAVCRVEQLYPFPADALGTLVATYRNLDEVVWLQEEPVNMGAWTFVRDHLAAIAGDVPVRYVGRPRSASPAEGSSAWHQLHQKAIVDEVYAFAKVPQRKTGTRA